MFRIFPRLEERADTPGGVLSGGEQKMLAICRTLMGDPDLIMVDEPTEGLSPMMVEHVGRLLEEIARRGVAILLVEQKLTIALKISHRLYVMGHGKIVYEGTPAALTRRRRTCARNGSRCEPGRILPSRGLEFPAIREKMQGISRISAHFRKNRPKNQIIRGSSSKIP